MLQQFAVCKMSVDFKQETKTNDLFLHLDMNIQG